MAVSYFSLIVIHTVVFIILRRCESQGGPPIVKAQATSRYARSRIANAQWVTTSMDLNANLARRATFALAVVELSHVALTTGTAGAAKASAAHAHSGGSRLEVVFAQEQVAKLRRSAQHPKGTIVSPGLP